MGIATFKEWKKDNPEGTRQDYNQVLGSHNVLHLRAIREDMPCPFGSNCTGWVSEPNWGLIRRTWDRIHGVEDPWGNYGV